MRLHRSSPEVDDWSNSASVQHRPGICETLFHNFFFLFLFYHLFLCTQRGSCLFKNKGANDGGDIMSHTHPQVAAL